MQEIELERTYLAKEIPKDIKNFPSKEMLDIYLPSTSHHPVLRLRKQGNKLQIMKKRPVNEGNFSEFLEESVALTPDEYAELSTLQGKRVGKIRYYYQHNGVDFEVDVFIGDLSGLVLVDVEFSSVEAKDKCTLPSFCLAEVTQEPFIAGGMICGKSYADIQADLNRFSYQKL